MIFYSTFQLGFSLTLANSIILFTIFIRTYREFSTINLITRVENSHWCLNLFKTRTKFHLSKNNIMETPRKFMFLRGASTICGTPCIEHKWPNKFNCITKQPMLSTLHVSLTQYLVQFGKKILHYFAVFLQWWRIATDKLILVSKLKMKAKKSWLVREQ